MDLAGQDDAKALHGQQRHDPSVAPPPRGHFEGRQRRDEIRARTHDGDAEDASASSGRSARRTIADEENDRNQRRSGR